MKKKQEYEWHVDFYQERPGSSFWSAGLFIGAKDGYHHAGNSFIINFRSALLRKDNETGYYYEPDSSFASPDPVSPSKIQPEFRGNKVGKWWGMSIETEPSHSRYSFEDGLVYAAQVMGIINKTIDRFNLHFKYSEDVLCQVIASLNNMDNFHYETDLTQMPVLDSIV